MHKIDNYKIFLVGGTGELAEFLISQIDRMNNVFYAQDFVKLSSNWRMKQFVLKQITSSKRTVIEWENLLILEKAKCHLFLFLPPDAFQMIRIF